MVAICASLRTSHSPTPSGSSPPAVQAVCQGAETPRCSPERRVAPSGILSVSFAFSCFLPGCGLYPFVIRMVVNRSRRPALKHPHRFRLLRFCLVAFGIFAGFSQSSRHRLKWRLSQPFVALLAPVCLPSLSSSLSVDHGQNKIASFL